MYFFAWESEVDGESRQDLKSLKRPKSEEVMKTKHTSDFRLQKPRLSLKNNLIRLGIDREAQSK